MKFCKYLNISPECNFNPTLLYILYELSIKWLLSYNLILKINFQMNFSWLPTTWRSTFYGTLPKNFTTISVILGDRQSYMAPNTSWIMEVWMDQRKWEENYKKKMSPLQCQHLTGKLMSQLLILSSTLYYNYDEFPKLMSKKKKKKRELFINKISPLWY